MHTINNSCIIKSVVVVCLFFFYYIHLPATQAVCFYFSDIIMIKKPSFTALLPVLTTLNAFISSHAHVNVLLPSFDIARLWI